jgi:conjugal transfer pilus assembly protein TraU
MNILSIIKKLAVLLIAMAMMSPVFAQDPPPANPPATPADPLNKDATCNGKFMNPITDVCWSCLFPLKLGGLTMYSGGQLDNNSSTGSPFCYCGGNRGGNIRIGVHVGFWEPSRVVEVVRKPYCFPSLGGINLNVGIHAPAQGRKAQGADSVVSFYQVHWYMNPLLFWLEVLIDNNCLEQSVFDLAYITELDPLWNDSETTFIINPDAALFSSLPAQAACAADCVAASTGMPLNQLFWCAGCQGSMYPLAGFVTGHTGGVSTSTLLVQRMTNKLHREGLMWGASGKDGLCGYYLQPLMDKHNYKMQMVYPVRNTQKIDRQCCQPFGRSTLLWGAGREFLFRGEDFAYMLFRKRDCCQGAYP